MQNYQKKIGIALKSLGERKIIVHLEDTKITVVGVSRIGYTEFGGEEIGKLYHVLRKQIAECEKTRGNLKTVLNIARDAAIAVSALDHDFLVTCDKCLSDSWRGVIGKHGILKQQFQVPEVIYAKPIPKQVAEQMLAPLH